jgi:hypothetical protein
MLLLASKWKEGLLGQWTRYEAGEVDHVQSAWDSGSLKQALVTGGEAGTGPEHFCISNEYQNEYKHPVAHNDGSKFRT